MSAGALQPAGVFGLPPPGPVETCRQAALQGASGDSIPSNFSPAGEAS